MSSLKVLLLGDNPNIILHASRFQLANSVDLYHVSESISNHYEIETQSYGVENFNLANHFTSILDLTNATNNELLFDLIILSATSLQELSNVSSQLSPLITNNTKIFVESTGSVQLEPFVRMSINCKHHVNVLSIVSDLDIRQIDSNQNKFKQFGDSNKQYTIYLGDGSSKSYGSTTQNLLNTFERLFTKLFPNEKLNLCDFSSKEFLKIQWQLALTTICFDPLLIMLEETSTKNLPNLILAKPLITGLVTEVTSILNKMGVQLDDNMSSESGLLAHWQSIYSAEVPPLVYHFIHKTSSLKIDLIWLQIILLADDQNIKTPYLEFLYSAMSQLQKVNNNESKWFTRTGETSANNGKQNDDLINSLKSETNHLTNELNSLQQTLKLKDNQLNEFQTTIDQLKDQLSTVKNDQNQTVNDYQAQIQKLNNQINDLKLTQSQQQINNNNSVNYPQENKMMVNKNLENVQNTSVSYKSTGTPDLNDLEDLAVFGVSYGDSPLRTMNKSQKGEPQQATSSNGSATSQNINANSSDSNTSQGDVEDSRILQERELDLKRKELELQERELELQRRALQQQQQYSSGRKSKMNNNNQMPPPQQQPQHVNPMNQRGQAYNQMPQQNFVPNMRPNRNLHGANSSGSSAANFNDPISGAVGMGYTGGFPQSQQQQVPPQQQSQQFHHAIKPTSRKNRTSNMPNLRNPSNSNMTGFQNSMINNVPPSMNSQSRLNSLSSQSMNFQSRMRNPQQQQQQQNMHSSSFNNLNSNIRANTMQHMPAGFNQQQLQQRQVSSSSVDINNVGNISTNSVVHNQLRPTGSMSNVNVMQQSSTMPSLQQSQQQPQAHVPIQLGTPPIPPSASNAAVESSPASFASTNTNSTSQTTDSEKKKKKKFGFFKKKSKK